MDAAGGIEKPDDLACIVDAVGIGDGGGRGVVEGGEAAAAKEETVVGPTAVVTEQADDPGPCSLIPRAAVPLTRTGSLRVAEGSSRVVKMIGMLVALLVA